MTQQWEGWWEPVDGSPSPDLHGKVEYEPTFDEDGMEVDLLVRDLDVPDGDEVSVVWGETVVLTARIEGGGAHTAVRTTEGHAVPDLSGQAVELRHRGVVLARAVLEPD